MQSDFCMVSTTVNSNGLVRSETGDPIPLCGGGKKVSTTVSGTKQACTERAVPDKDEKEIHMTRPSLIDRVESTWASRSARNGLITRAYRQILRPALAWLTRHCLLGALFTVSSSTCDL